MSEKVRFFVVIELPVAYQNTDPADMAMWLADHVKDEPEVEITAYDNFTDLVLAETSPKGLAKRRLAKRQGIGDVEA